jgi:hypothetical protein
MSHENNIWCPDCGEAETGGELCDRCRADRKWTAWLAAALREIIAASERHGWDDCEGHDSLIYILADAESETQRAASIYITLRRGEDDAAEEINVRISDHGRNVQRGRETRQAEADLSVAMLPDGGDARIEHVAAWFAARN